jgi:hypothetical protein
MKAVVVRARASFLAFVLVAACGDAPGDTDAAPVVPAPDAGPPTPATLELQLAAGAFLPHDATTPNAILYVPTRFTNDLPLDVVVYIHGFNNCIRNAIRPENGTCTPGGAVHNAYDLLTQLEASNKNAILLLPEVAFEMASGAIG